jgi:hypothetical protein
MGNDNRALGVERWREHRVHAPVNPSRMNDAVKVGTMLSSSTGPVPILEDPSEG